MSFRHQPLRSARSSAISESGQALGLLLCAIAIIALLAVGVSRLGVRLAHRAMAQTAADAAALAGVESGIGAAQQLVSANGASVVSWSASDRVFTITVRVGTETATARASLQEIDQGVAQFADVQPSTLKNRGHQRAP